MPNRTYQLYNLNTPNQPITTQSMASHLHIPGQPCVDRGYAGKQAQAMAYQVSTSNYRTNIDGKCVPVNLQPYGCDETYCSMYNPVPGPITQNYVLPGGVISAVKYFRSYNQSDAQQQLHNDRRVHDLCYSF